jgi:hypothetical protein
MATDDQTLPVIIPSPAEDSASVDVDDVSAEKLASLDALDGQTFVLLTDRVRLEGGPNSFGAFAIALLPQISGIKVAPRPKDRGSLVWGVIGVLAAIGVWQVATNGIVSSFGGLIVGAISLVLLGEYFLRPPDLEFEIVLGSNSLNADIKRARRNDAIAFSERIFEARSQMLEPATSAKLAEDSEPTLVTPTSLPPRFPIP